MITTKIAIFYINFDIRRHLPYRYIINSISMHWLAYMVLKIFGWKVEKGIPAGVKKAVVIMAPHTSNWDFVIGRLSFVAEGTRVHLMIKKESFFFPLGVILRALGGIPVDRSHSQNTVKSVTQHFNKADSFFLIITPEGTRKRVNRWKKGFYFIAQNAQVPIACGFLDYKRKVGGIGPVIYPSGDYDKDLEKIENFYRGMHARHPQNFNLSSPAEPEPPRD